MFRWVKMGSDGLRLVQMGSDWFIWGQMGLVQMGSDWFRWVQMGSDEFRRVQM